MVSELLSRGPEQSLLSMGLHVVEHTLGMLKARTQTLGTSTDFTLAYFIVKEMTK